MALIDNIKTGSNMIDNRTKATTADLNVNDYDAMFRLLCKDIARISIPEARKKYECQGKNKASLKSVMLLCVDNHLAFEVDPVVGKFKVTHQEKGKDPIEWKSNDLSKTEISGKVKQEKIESAKLDKELTKTESQEPMVDKNHRDNLPGQTENADNNKELLIAKKEEVDSLTNGELKPDIVETVSSETIFSGKEDEELF